jgi:hypothetical protein
VVPTSMDGTDDELVSPFAPAWPGSMWPLLLEQVFCYYHALDLVGTLVDLGVLTESSTLSAEPVFVRNFVHHVH